MTGTCRSRLLALCLTLTGALLAGAGTARGAAAPAAPAPLVVASDKELGFFTASRSETLAAFKRIGLLPVRVPASFDARQDVKDTLQRLVVDYFKRAGFDVVAPDTYSKAYDKFNHQVGGTYDAETGAGKPAQLQAVLDNAHREFIEAEHLDGYAIVRVVQVRAHFSSPYANWDGARERSSGRLPANGLSEFLLTDNTSSGTLPAYSLIVQIANAQDKIVYGRAGGIQLGSYFDVQKAKGVNDFLDVPRDNLFRDEARLERAVRVATLPLLRSAEQIAAGAADPASNPELIKPADLPPVPAGVEPQAESALRVPREQLLASVHRVALAPLYVGQFTMDQATQERYLELIRAELKGLGWELVNAPNAAAASKTALAESGGLFDPYTGARDTARATAVRKAVIPALGLDPAPDAVLWPSIVRTVAPHDRGDASWDGVSQSGVTLGPVRKGFSFWRTANGQGSGEGVLLAASLGMQLVGASGEELYQGRGGIQLLEQLKGTKHAALAPDELFHDVTREAPAVHAALRELTLSAADLDRELHPEKYPGKH